MCEQVLLRTRVMLTLGHLVATCLVSSQYSSSGSGQQTGIEVRQSTLLQRCGYVYCK